MSITMTRSGSGAYTLATDARSVLLTAEEIRFLRSFFAQDDLHNAVEDALARAEDDGEVTFSDWSAITFDDYASEADARADFVEYVVESITENDALYENDPHHAPTDVYQWVLDLADEIGYVKE